MYYIVCIESLKGVDNMAQKTLSIRMDEDIKKEFDAFCTEVGMNTSVAINLFAKAVLREKRIPFEITTNNDPFHSDDNQARLVRAAERMNKTGGTVHELVEIEK